jgi:hypothetical protein
MEEQYKITNLSHHITDLVFKDYTEFNAWGIKNNVSGVQYEQLTGFNKVTHRILISEYDAYYYILRRFDGYTFSFNEMQLVNNALEADSVSFGQIANVTLRQGIDNKGRDFINLYIVDNRINTRTYIPALTSINSYIAKSKSDVIGLLAIEYSNYKVAKTKMTKQEFVGLQAKLNMSGVPSMVVDLNTLAIVQNNKILIYTRQKGIRKSYYSEDFV